KIRSEIDQCCNGSEIRKQSFPVKMRKDISRNAETVGPDQAPVFRHTPGIRDMPADHFLAVCRTAKHKPLKRKQLCSRRKLNFCLSVKTCPIEDDSFLREPREFRAFVGAELCRNLRSLAQRPIDFFGCL